MAKKDQTDSKKRHHFVDIIDEKAQLSQHYVILLVASTLIAALGLLVDNSAVIIGAMMMAPLWWPVVQFTYGIVGMRKGYLRKSVSTFLISVLIVLLVSIVTSLFLPLRVDTNEILLRTQPTIIDLFIGLAASVVGVLALYSPKVATNVSGVAISLALLPPLVVSGIGMAERRPSMIVDAGLLFISNVGATIVAGVITLLILGFKARGEERRKKSFAAFALSAIILTAIALPLTAYLTDSLESERTRSQVKRTINQYTEEQAPQVEVGETEITFETSQESEKVIKAVVTLFVPQSVTISESFELGLVEQLNQINSSTTDLTLRTVSTSTLVKKSTQEEQETNRRVRDIVSEHFPDAAIRDIAISYLSENDEEQSVKVVISLQGAQPIYSSKKEAELEKELAVLLDKDVDVLLELSPVVVYNRQELLLEEAEDQLFEVTRETLNEATVSAQVVEATFNTETADNLRQATIKLEVFDEIEDPEVFKSLLNQNIAELFEQSIDTQITIIEAEIL